jgi:hypothetical protein
MHLTAKLQLPKLNLNRCKELLNRRLSEGLAQASRQWLVTTAEIIPVWSGASKATFSPLASHAEYALLISPVVPSRIELGLEHGTAQYEADKNTGLYSFTYLTTLPHLVVNEYYNANEFRDPITGEQTFHLKRPGPYHFQEKGREAFKRFMQTEFVGLPDWRTCIEV